MNNEKRFECDVVVMPGAELDTDICITGNVYMAEGSNANGYDIDVGESFFANHADFFNVHAGEDFSITRSIGNDVRVEGDVILKDICVLGDVFLLTEMLAFLQILLFGMFLLWALLKFK